MNQVQICSQKDVTATPEVACSDRIQLGIFAHAKVVQGSSTGGYALFLGTKISAK
jgi:hypothetical protein